jgi:gas vesicle protein
MYEKPFERESGGGFVMGLMCGVAIGAAMGLVLAPKTGAELRRTLQDSTDDLRKKAGEAYNQASETVNDAVAKSREAVSRGRQAFESARVTAAQSS